MPRRRRRKRRTHSASDLRQIAWAQRILILCLLGHLVLWLGYIGLSVSGARMGGRGSDTFETVMIISVGLGLLSGIFVLLVEAKLSGLIIGFLIGLLTAVPCLGLLLILVVNTRATSTLQANGVHVGLIGARTSDLNALSEDPDEDEDGDSEDDDDYDDRPNGRSRRASRYEVDEREGW